MVTKNEGGREFSPGLALWRIANWTYCFHVKNPFPFPLATALLIGDVIMNRRSGVKMFLSVITTPIGNARWTAQKIREISIDWIFILQICSATPIQDINTSAPILLELWIFISWICNGKLVSSYWPKFAARPLFVETMPIYKAVATGNRNNELYRETARSNWK